MLLTTRLSIQSKLVLLLLLVSIGSMFVIAVIGYTSGREALEQSVYHHMTSVRAARADQLQTRDGLGQTGEVYLVRPDHLMLSMSRFFYQDPESYLASLLEAGYPVNQVERIRRAGTTILIQEDRSPTSGGIPSQ
jgi:hypothetical protein